MKRNKIRLWTILCVCFVLILQGCGSTKEPRIMVLNQQNVQMTVGDTTEISIDSAIANSCKHLTWSLKDDTVVSMSDLNNGTVQITALAAGNTFVYVTADGYTTVSCKITVKEPEKKEVSFEGTAWQAKDLYFYFYDNMYCFLCEEKDVFDDNMYVGKYTYVEVSEATARDDYTDPIVDEMLETVPKGRMYELTLNVDLTITDGEKEFYGLAEDDSKVLDFLILADGEGHTSFCNVDVAVEASEITLKGTDVDIDSFYSEDTDVASFTASGNSYSSYYIANCDDIILSKDNSGYLNYLYFSELGTGAVPSSFMGNLSDELYVSFFCCEGYDIYWAVTDWGDQWYLYHGDLSGEGTYELILDVKVEELIIKDNYIYITDKESFILRADRNGDNMQTIYSGTLQAFEVGDDVLYIYSGSDLFSCDLSGNIVDMFVTDLGLSIQQMRYSSGMVFFTCFVPSSSQTALAVLFTDTGETSVLTDLCDGSEFDTSLIAVYDHYLFYKTGDATELRRFDTSTFEVDTVVLSEAIPGLSTVRPLVDIQVVYDVLMIAAYDSTHSVEYYAVDADTLEFYHIDEL